MEMEKENGNEAENEKKYESGRSLRTGWYEHDVEYCNYHCLLLLLWPSILSLQS